MISKEIDIYLCVSFIPTPELSSLAKSVAKACISQNFAPIATDLKTEMTTNCRAKSSCYFDHCTDMNAQVDVNR